MVACAKLCLQIGMFNVGISCICHYRLLILNYTAYTFAYGKTEILCHGCIILSLSHTHIQYCYRACRRSAPPTYQPSTKQKRIVIFPVDRMCLYVISRITKIQFYSLFGSPISFHKVVARPHKIFCCPGII